MTENISSITELESYLSLKEDLQRHMELYYNQNAPEISDYEYDMLMQKLKVTEKEHPEWVKSDSPSQIVEIKPTKRTLGVSVTHNVPMLSIEDVFTKEDVINWVHKVRAVFPDVTFCVEYKIDGASMTLRYEHGTLVMAESRGDGYIGEDITVNAKEISDVCKEIAMSDYLELRGEVYMTHANLDSVNKQLELEGKKLMENTRNLAAGTLRHLDPTVVKKRGLNMFIFNVQDGPSEFKQTHEDGLHLVEAAGFKTVPSILCKTDEEIISAIDQIGEKRGELLYDIDGAVIKINQIAYRNRFASTAKYSAGHIAYKYPPEEKEAKLLDIELQVGRTGKITPVAIFEPIRLCGTTVSRATLHNQNFINDLGIKIGSTLVVYKSGEIIPTVKAVVPEKQPNCEVYRIPRICPVCGALAIQNEDSADIKCSSDTCRSKLVGRLLNFVSRDAVNMKGFGAEYISALVDQGYLSSLEDIYSLKEKREQLIANGVLGKAKNTDKLLAVIEESKSGDAYRVIAGMNIPNVGVASAKNLMQYFHNMDALMNASVSDLLELDDIGEITAQSIYEYFHKEDNVRMVDALKTAGVNLVAEKIISGSQFDGLTFCITGTLPTLGRKEAADFIESHGGKVTGSVSKKTSYLVAGEAAGSKLDKAMQLGVPVISEQELVKFRL